MKNTRTGFILRKKVIRSEIKKLDKLYIEKVNPYSDDDIRNMDRTSAIDLAAFIYNDRAVDHIGKLYTSITDLHALMEDDIRPYFEFPE